MTKPLALGKAVHKGIEMLIQGYTLEEAVCEGFIEADFHPQVERSEVESLVKKSPVHAGMGETEVHFQLPSPILLQPHSYRATLIWLSKTNLVYGLSIGKPIGNRTTFSTTCSLPCMRGC
ncbi:hypothetical protein J2S00_000933 [Caldalkalibacillus uzonensis]|uniref:Uncharacterized protein n=1 Tax=Caldalkalibacillus uzonensis TaxID=353224 RepID=A0ABU0CQH3_9BACI|nr:hypothetical protein [Caldalkalibacillus uzonensis]